MILSCPTLSQLDCLNKMKTLLFTLLMMWMGSTYGQFIFPKPAPKIDTASFRWKPMKKGVEITFHGILIGSGAKAGIAQGQNDAIEDNKWGFRERHPNLSESWWNKDSSAARLNAQSYINQNFLAGFQDLWHRNQMGVNICLGIQFFTVGVLTLNDFKKHKKFRWHVPLLLAVEANASRMLMKRATLEYYDVF